MGKALEKDLLWRVDRRRRRRCGPGIRSRVPHGHAHDAVVREQPHPSTCWRELSCVVEVVCRVHARWYSVLTHWPVVVSVCRVWEVDAKLRHSPRTPRVATGFILVFPRRSSPSARPGATGPATARTRTHRTQRIAEHPGFHSAHKRHSPARVHAVLAKPHVRVCM